MSDRLNPGDSLAVGGSITSQDGRFTLILQADGNLVLYQSGGSARWATGNVGTVSQAIMQADGNFVLYGPAGPLWATGTDGHPGSYLSIQNDGNVVIYGPGGALWAVPSTMPNLTGAWAADGGASYYIRHLDDNSIWWAGLSGSPSSEFYTGLAYTNVFQGWLDPVSRTIVGSWTDVPRGGNAGHGNLSLDIVEIDTGGRPGGPLHQPTFQLRQNPTGTTGGFGPMVWQQELPWSPFDITYRFEHVRRYDSQFSRDNKPFKDFAVVFGTVTGFPHLNWKESIPRDYCIFVFPIHPGDCVNPETGGTDACDGDLTFDLMDPHSGFMDLQLEQDFWNVGWLDSPLPWISLSSSSIIQRHLANNGNHIHCEIVMFGRTNNEDDCRVAPNVLLPGWMETEGNSVLFNGQPVNGQVTQVQYTADPRFVQVYLLGTPLLPGLVVRVTGVVNLDEHDYGTDMISPGHPFPEFRGGPELHPVYAIDVLQDFTRPRPGADLTGAWHCDDVGTYYIRQLDDGAVWWLGLSRDQGQSFANAFRGSIVYHDNEGVPLRVPIIDGRWTDVPLGTEGTMSSGKLVLEWSGAGGINTATTLTATFKTGGFGGSTWRKLYDR